ncbi:hypothetical protein EC973_005156 [Apophysomyces ossiformis]|uniref:XPA C-terminal domain-containing protein n=1 Tax=Apophysomyces ossiformis TaxID=679940 RepID=A0A8H7BJR5_9FUNG|nr:hypothetical protein EC973_005156 [Apophysomyces ossiformis]
MEEESSTTSSLTAEQQKRIEESRSKAIEKLRAKRKATESHQADDRNPSAATQHGEHAERATKRSRWTASYYEYNLSNMEDSKAGYILDESSEKSSKKDKITKIEPYLPRSLDPSENPTCRDCKSMDLDPTFFQVFGLLVCPSCKEAQPDKYSLITKTEAKEDYLLTDEELRDKDILPHWSKPNPHKSTWNNMMLYVREMVEDYAFKKWNGPEGLDAEYERREAYKKAKKDKKFKDKLADLRRRTMMSTWERKRMDGPHKHEFAPVIEDEEASTTTQTCITCGLVIESEEF